MFWAKVVTAVAVAAFVVIAVGVAGVTGYGMYLNRQDAKSCADLYPNDWKQYEACRVILERVRQLQPKRIAAKL